MFKRICIELTEPICACETSQLSWGITDDTDLLIGCKGCGIKTIIPYDKFVAHFSLDKKYPKYKCKICDKLHETGLSHDQAIIKDVIE